MTTRAAVVAEARTWLQPVPTRFRHQAHTKGLATDCAGLVGSVGVAVGLFPAVVWSGEFAAHAGYARTPTNGMLLEVCRRHLVEIILVGEAQAGDVVLMRFATEPQHLGILVPYPLGGMALVHAYSRARKVVEHRLDDKWRERVTHAFAYPGITGTGAAP